MKRCCLCREHKPEVDYQSNRANKDGLQSACRECTNARNRDWAKANRELRAKRLRDAAAAQPSGWRRERTRDYRKRNPEKYYAHNALYAAVRDGRLERPDFCEECGGPKPQGHHDDYSKPLEVRWLCQPCHAEAHRLAA